MLHTVGIILQTQEVLSMNVKLKLMAFVSVCFVSRRQLVIDEIQQDGHYLVDSLMALIKQFFQRGEYSQMNFIFQILLGIGNRAKTQFFLQRLDVEIASYLKSLLKSNDSTAAKKVLLVFKYLFAGTGNKNEDAEQYDFESFKNISSMLSQIYKTFMQPTNLDILQCSADVVNNWYLNEEMNSSL